MPKEYYSEMTDRELAEHIARNSDQIVGAIVAMSETAKDSHTILESLNDVFKKMQKRFPLLRIGL